MPEFPRRSSDTADVPGAMTRRAFSTTLTAGAIGSALPGLPGAAFAAETGSVYCNVNVTNEASVDAGFAQARAANGQERILVNCAGVAIGQRIARKGKDGAAAVPHDLAAFSRVISINLIGTFLMMSKCSAGMMALDPIGDDGERGVMINTSSVAAEDGQIGQVAYAASKGGVKSMVLPIARDLAQSGIRVCAILPGLFHTPMFDGLPEDARRSLAATVPFPSRLGNATEYAALATHICENVMLNGECIRLDGAIRLAPR